MGSDEKKFIYYFLEEKGHKKRGAKCSTANLQDAMNDSIRK